jgi:predicted acetyltransferase
MNAVHHAKLRAAKWHYDPVSERYSAPGVPLDGAQKMFTQAEAWEQYEAALAKEKQPAAKDVKKVDEAG